MGTESEVIRAVYKRNPAQECPVQMQEENSAEEEKTLARKCTEGIIFRKGMKE